MSDALLIVDDREDDSVLLERMLRRLGVGNAIVKLPGGEEAIQYLSGEWRYKDRERYPLPSVIFLDLKMPGKNGFEVLEWIRSNPLPQRCLVLIVSELNALADIRRAYRLGANSFLSKPLNEAEIRECLRNHPESWDFADPNSLEAAC
jgi:CheY-like chemotaxis protein